MNARLASTLQMWLLSRTFRWETAWVEACGLHLEPEVILMVNPKKNQRSGGPKNSQMSGGSPPTSLLFIFSELCYCGHRGARGLKGDSADGLERHQP